MSRHQSDHDRIVSSGAWAGAFLFTVAMLWVSVKLPFALAWLINSAVVIGTSYLMARWKRAWYAWLCFWIIVGVCAANGLLKAATPWLDHPWSSASWIVAWVVVWSWYWLVRIPRRHPPAPPQVSHVVHHHVVHGVQGVQLPAGVDVTAVPGVVIPGEVEAGRRREIEAPKVRGDGLRGLLGDAVAEVRRPRPGR